MYELDFSKKTKKRLDKYLSKVQPANKDRALAVVASLRDDPRSGLGSKHLLQGNRAGSWSCTLYGGLRLVYWIDDENKRVVPFDFIVTHDYGRDSLDLF